jgi:hypothetical protein
VCFEKGQVQSRRADIIGIGIAIGIGFFETVHFGSDRL